MARPGRLEEVRRALERLGPTWEKRLAGRRSRWRQTVDVLHAQDLEDFFKSVGKSVWLVLENGIRNVPPLITAVVVVFVTGDAWKILGAGFTFRFFALVTLFLGGSLVFLARRPKNYWATDVEVCESEADTILNTPDGGDQPNKRKAAVETGRRNKPQLLQQARSLGVKPVPLVIPKKRIGRASVYLGYLSLLGFSLVLIAGAIAICLMVIGVILVSEQGTIDLAHLDPNKSVHAWRIGNLVLTRELGSLSLSLGAFAAFFLVATQRDEDRQKFMNHTLLRFHKVLLVYSVYCRVHDSARAWTGVPVVADRLADGPEDAGTAVATA